MRAVLCPFSNPCLRQPSQSCLNRLNLGTVSGLLAIQYCGALRGMLFMVVTFTPQSIYPKVPIGCIHDWMGPRTGLEGVDRQMGQYCKNLQLCSYVSTFVAIFLNKSCSS
jgi:hypothetical protein